MEARHLRDQGQAAEEAGEYARAVSLLERSLAIREKVLGPEHLAVAQTLFGLGVIHQHMGAYEKAVLYQHRVLAIREKTLGPDHPLVGAALNRLAFLHRELGAYEQALALAQHGLVIREKAFGNDHWTVAASLNNLSIIFRRRGDYESAIAAARRSLAIYERVLDPSYVESMASVQTAGKWHDIAHVEITTSLVNLAQALDLAKREAEARPLLERALSIASAAGKPRYLAQVYRNLALLHARHGRLDQAIVFGTQSVNLRQAFRHEIGDLDADVQQSFADTNERDYQDLAGWLIRSGRGPEAQFVLSMQASGRSFTPSQAGKDPEVIRGENLGKIVGDGLGPQKLD